MIQEQVLNKIIQEKDASIITLNNLTDAYFSDYKDEFWFIKNHLTKYSVIPDMETFLAAFPDFQVITVNEPVSYLLEELMKDKNKRFLAENYTKVRQLIMENKVDEALQILKEASEESASFVSLQCVDILKDTSRYDAYVEKINNYDKYFKDQEKTFLWVKEGEQYKLEAEEVNLSKALNEDEIQSLNKVTTKIKVEIGEKELATETINGVKVNRKIGTINIKDDKDATYSYKIVKASKGTEAKQLMDLAEQMNKMDNKNMFEKLSIYSEFKELYSKLEPTVSDRNWTKVKDYAIEQPQDSKKGDQYLVWLKKDLGNNSVVDVQLMNCNDDYTPAYEKQEVVVKQTSKLPITYDNIILFVIAGILLALIIAIVILKLRNKKEQK